MIPSFEKRKQIAVSIIAALDEHKPAAQFLLSLTADDRAALKALKNVPVFLIMPYLTETVDLRANREFLQENGGTYIREIIKLL